jgi:predicted acyltransferase
MSAPTRLTSLDQFRGYTVLGMFVVNFVGGLDHVHPLLQHHHTYCSYADTIMPQFLLAVGFGFRLSFLRRRERNGTWAAVRHALTRNFGLILLGIVLYHLTGGFHEWKDLLAVDPGAFALKLFKRGPFETLTHIGVTSLWVLLVIGARSWVRVLFAVASAGLHVWLSKLGYYEWNLAEPKGIDGGPLAFLSWTVPLITGTLAHDWVTGPEDPNEGRTARLVTAGVLLMILGYVLSCLSRWTPPNVGTTTGAWWRDQLADPPFVPLSEPWRLNYWVMSQRAGSITYTTFAAGFGLAVYALFRWACDVRGWAWGYLDLFGRHALTGYILHQLVEGAVRPFVPKDAPWWYVALACGVYLGVITLFLRHLDRHKLVLKL